MPAGVQPKLQQQRLQADKSSNEMSPTIIAGSLEACHRPVQASYRAKSTAKMLHAAAPAACPSFGAMINHSQTKTCTLLNLLAPVILWRSVWKAHSP
jgi:hypothetical protein